MVTKLAGEDLIKISMLLCLAGTLIMILMGELRKILAQHKTKMIVYAIVLLLCSAVIAVVSSKNVLHATPLVHLIAFQILFTLLGSIHVWGLRTFFPKLSEDKATFFIEFLCSVALMLIGLIGFINITGYFQPQYVWYFIPSILFFLIPIWTLKLYEFAMHIPIAQYTKWYYPMSANFKEPEDHEYANPILITLEFERKLEDRDFIAFKIKAPEKMNFGRLFYFFIDDYNQIHTDATIDVVDAQDDPVGWIFYYKPGWFRKIRYLNAEHTILRNQLQENTTVFCKRIINTDHNNS